MAQKAGNLARLAALWEIFRRRRHPLRSRVRAIIVALNG
jgi:hypothetical protein